VEDWEEFPLIWETGSLIFILRSDGDRVIVAGRMMNAGGGGSGARLPGKAKALVKKLEALLPGRL